MKQHISHYETGFSVGETKKDRDHSNWSVLKTRLKKEGSDFFPFIRKGSPKSYFLSGKYRNFRQFQEIK